MQDSIPNLTVVVDFDDLDQEVKDISQGEQAEGKLSKQYTEDKLMNSVLAGDKQTIEHAEMIHEATNRSVGAFTPDLLFASMTKNFSIAKQLYGDKILRLLTGYDPNYIEKNLKIPEFKKELQQAIYETVNQMKDEGLLDKDGMITNSGIELSALVLIKELDNYITKDKTGDKTSKKTSHYGEKAGTRNYRKGDRYKDLNIKKTVHRAIRRGHASLTPDDLVISEREGKGKVSIIYALDASSSMKGSKLDTCKKAGIALAHRAIQEKDEVGLIVFGSEIKETIPPTHDFPLLLNTISRVRASRQTDLKAMIEKSVEIFHPLKSTKHLVILTDALPTVGKEPEDETLRAVGTAKGAGITISIVGIGLDKAGVRLAKEITKIGEGKFNYVKDLKDVGTIVLQDYYQLK